MPTCVFGVVCLRRESHAGAVRAAGLGGGVVGAAAVPRETNLEHGRVGTCTWINLKILSDFLLHFLIVFVLLTLDVRNL